MAPIDRAPARSQRNPGNWMWPATTIIAVLAIAIWLVRRPVPDKVQDCIATVLASKQIKIDERQLALSAEIVKSGKLDLQDSSSTNTDFRRELSDAVLLSALEVCRDVYKRGLDAPNGVTPARAPLEVVASPLVTVEVRRGSRSYPQRGVRVYSTFEKVGECVTTERGQCRLPILSAMSTDTITLKADYVGVVGNQLSIGELLKGTTIQVQAPLPLVTVRASQCDGQPLAGRVQFDAAQAEIAADGCTRDDGTCKEAVLVNGEARFHYDPETLGTVELHVVPHSGLSESHTYTALSGVITVTYPSNCKIPVPSLPRCSKALTLGLRNQAVSATGSDRGNVALRVKGGVISVLEAPASVRLQLDQNRVESADCLGSFHLP